MKVHLILLLLLLLLASLLLVGGQSEQPARRELKLPKLFDFHNFRRLFKRSYASTLELIARQRLYLARAFQVFVANVCYKSGRQSHYLAITELADRTPEEVVRTHLRPAGGRRSRPPLAELADESTVWRELEAALAGDGDQPLAADIARELRPRNRRQVSRRQLSVDELALAAERLAAPASPKQVSRVASNNPEYEAPDLMSFGADTPDFLVHRMDPQTVDELSQRPARLVYPLASRGSKRKVGPQPPDQVHVDHRKSGCLLAARSQMDCASCYLFPVLASFEWLYCMQTGKLVAFSEQYPLECGWRANLEACNGGYLEDVFAFSQLYGLALRRDYAYSDQPGECPYHPKVPARSMGYIRADNTTHKLVRRHQIDQELKHAPVALNIAVNDKFHLYGGGVDTGKGCKRDWVHAVLAVGSGREDGVEYYLLRNSYGLTFGEAGHYKLAKQSSCLAQDDECFVIGGHFHQLPEANLNPRHRADCYQAKLRQLFQASVANPMGVVDDTAELVPAECPK